MKKFFGICMLLAAFMNINSTIACAAYKKEYKLDIVPSINSGWGMGAQYFTDLVRERSKGRINIKVYANSQLTTGKQTNAFMLIRNGTIDFACQSTINYSPQVAEANLFALPFFISGQPDRYKALDAITGGKSGKMVAEAIEAKGVKFLCYGENGFRELTNGKKMVKSPEDLRDLKIRVVGSPLFIDTLTALGSNPLTMSWSDTIAALQQGVADGQENPINIFYPINIHEYNKYVTNWHYVADPTLFVANPKVWNSFTPDDQKLILGAAKDAAAYQIALARVGIDENDRGKNLKYLQSIGKAPAITDWNTELKRIGMVVTELTAAEKTAFASKSKPVIDQWRNKIGAGLVKAAEEDMARVK